jgi:O-antigen ligase
MNEFKFNFFAKLNRPKLLWWSILTIAFILPVSQFICIKLIFFTLFFSFLVKRNEQHSSLFVNACDNILYLLVMITGLLYSEDAAFGLSVLETNFSFLALPIILYKVGDFNKKKIHQLFQGFALGLISSSLICLANAIIAYVNNNDSHLFFFYELTNVLDFQPTYFAYYLIFAITFGLYLLYFHQVRNYKLILALLLYLFIILMFSGGLTSFISVLLILSFFVLKFWMDEKTIIRYQTFAVVTLMIAGMFFFSYIYKKMDDPSAKITDRWERVELWESAIKANPNIWLGVGTGDYKKELNQYYIDHQMPVYARESYNAHNQFLQILFSNGIIGLVALFILLVRPLYLSIRNQNVLGALTFFPFLIYGMTEVFLGRFQGVVFFALLHQAFIALYANNRPGQNIL